MTRLIRLLPIAVLLLLVPGCSVTGPGDKEIEALLPSSAGLFVGNDVGILGVNVGKVTAIEPEGDHVRVTMQVDGERAVPADAGAVVVARSVATDRYVELTPVYREGPKMEDGAVIPLERTRTPVEFDEVLATLNEFATGIAGNKETGAAIRTFLAQGAKALKGKGGLINQTITSLGSAVDSIAGQREEIVGAVKSLDALVSTIAANEQTTREFIRQVSAASQQLAAERNNFRAALRSLDRAVTVVAEFAVQNRAEIVRSLDSSAAVMRDIMSRQEDLSEVLRNFPLGLENLRRTSHDGRLAVRISPLILAPLGDQLTVICESLPFDLCENFGTDPGGILEDVLGGLLGGGR